MSSHYSSRSGHYDEPRGRRSSSHSRAGPPPVISYSSSSGGGQRRASSTHSGAGGGQRRASSTHSGSGRQDHGGYHTQESSRSYRRSSSADRDHGRDRDRDRGRGGSSSGYSYVAAPASSASQYRGNSGTVYYAQSGSHQPRARSNSDVYRDAGRHQQHSGVQIIRSHSREPQGHRRSRSQESRRSQHDHEGFGERMRRLFGLGPEHHEQRSRGDVRYLDASHRPATMGKSYGSSKHYGREIYMDTRTGREVDKHGRPVYVV